MKRLVCLLSAAVLLCATGVEAATIEFTALLSGLNENPPVSTTGSGSALVTYDSDLHTLVVSAQFQDLVGSTTVAHIHCCVNPPLNVGVATYPGTFPGFPAGVIFGSYLSPGPIDLTLISSYTGSFFTTFGGGTVEGAEAALVEGMLAGRAYFNIHTTFAPGGEIRGVLTQVPEPATLSLLGLGFGFAMVRRAGRASRRQKVSS